jgi:hypothetical protein
MNETLVYQDFDVSIRSPASGTGTRQVLWAIAQAISVAEQMHIFDRYERSALVESLVGLPAAVLGDEIARSDTLVVPEFLDLFAQRRYRRSLRELRQAVADGWEDQMVLLIDANVRGLAACIESWPAAHRRKFISRGGDRELIRSPIDGSTPRQIAAVAALLCQLGHDNVFDEAVMLCRDTSAADARARLEAKVRRGGLEPVTDEFDLCLMTFLRKPLDFDATTDFVLREAGAWKVLGAETWWHERVWPPELCKIRRVSWSY